MTRSRRTSLTLLLVLSGLALAAGVTSAAGATITPVSQTRTVAGFAFAEDLDGTGQDSDSDAATDFGPFNQGAAASVFLSNALASGGGTQNSTILPGSLNASGTSFANGEGYDYDSYGDASGSSDFSVTFTIDADTPYTLTGEISAFDDGSTELTLRSTSTGEIYAASAYGPAEMTTVDDSGMLTVGEYTLEINSGGSAYGDFFTFGYASTEYDVAFRIGDTGPGGEVPDGKDVAGAPLQVVKLGGGTVRLTWEASCRTGDADYGVYEGVLGSPDSFVPETCTTAGGLLRDLTPTNLDAAFLVVPNDGSTEGYYGNDSGGFDRSASASACFPQSLGSPVCP